MSRCPVFGGAHRHDADRIAVGGDISLLLGLGAGASVDDALLKLAAASLDFAVVKLSVYEQGTSTPIPNVLIEGLTSMSGGALYTDSQGKAIGRSESVRTTVRVSALYADLNATEVSYNTPYGTILNAAVYATRVAAGTVVEVLSTKEVMFSAKVASVDVHVIGGGEAGRGGGGTSHPDTRYIWGGDGGRGGRQKYQLNITVNARQKYNAVVGAANGGSSSFLGVSSQNGTLGAEDGGLAGGVIKGYQNTFESIAGKASTVKLFGSGTVKGGGSGGGGGARSNTGTVSSASSGGGPCGGAGGGFSAAGSAGRQPGGGGGGGGNWEGVGAQAGGDGGAGGVYFRWKYK